MLLLLSGRDAGIDTRRRLRLESTEPDGFRWDAGAGTEAPTAPGGRHRPQRARKGGNGCGWGVSTGWDPQGCSRMAPLVLPGAMNPFTLQDSCPLPFHRSQRPPAPVSRFNGISWHTSVQGQWCGVQGDEGSALGCWGPCTCWGAAGLVTAAPWGPARPPGDPRGSGWRGVVVHLQGLLLLQAHS